MTQTVETLYGTVDSDVFAVAKEIKLLIYMLRLVTLMNMDVQNVKMTY